MNKIPFIWQRDIIWGESNKIISDKEEVAEKLNHLFIETYRNLEIESYAPGNVIGISTEIWIPALLKGYKIALKNMNLILAS